MIPGIDGDKAIIPSSKATTGTTITARYDSCRILRQTGICVESSFVAAWANHFIDGGRYSRIAERTKGMATIANRIVPHTQLMAKRPETENAESAMKLRIHACPRHSSMVSRNNQTAIAIDDNAAKTTPIATSRKIAAVTVQGLGCVLVPFSFEGMVLLLSGIMWLIIP